MHAFNNTWRPWPRPTICLFLCLPDRIRNLIVLAGFQPKWSRVFVIFTRSTNKTGWLKKINCCKHFNFYCLTIKTTYKTYNNVYYHEKTVCSCLATEIISKEIVPILWTFDARACGGQELGWSVWDVCVTNLRILLPWLQVFWLGFWYHLKWSRHYKNPFQKFLPKKPSILSPMLLYFLKIGCTKMF